MHHGTCMTHVPWYMPGSLTSGFLSSRWRGKLSRQYFLWSRWRGKRSRHSRRMRNPQFYVSGKRPMGKNLSNCYMCLFHLNVGKLETECWLYSISVLCFCLCRSSDKLTKNQHNKDITLIRPQTIAMGFWKPLLCCNLHGYRLLKSRYWYMMFDAFMALKSFPRYWFFCEWNPLVARRFPSH